MGSSILNDVWQPTGLCYHRPLSKSKYFRFMILVGHNRGFSSKNQCEQPKISLHQKIVVSHWYAIFYLGPQYDSHQRSCRPSFRVSNDVYLGTSYMDAWSKSCGATSIWISMWERNVIHIEKVVNQCIKLWTLWHINIDAWPKISMWYHIGMSMDFVDRMMDLVAHQRRCLTQNIAGTTLVWIISHQRSRGASFHLSNDGSCGT